MSTIKSFNAICPSHAQLDQQLARAVGASRPRVDLVLADMCQAQPGTNLTKIVVNGPRHTTEQLSAASCRYRSNHHWQLQRLDSCLP